MPLSTSKGLCIVLENVEHLGTLSFRGTCRGYLFEVITPEGAADAAVKISRDGKVLRDILWPAYKVFNIAAHADDIAESLDEGLLVAGATGFGGNVYAKPLQDDEA